MDDIVSATTRRLAVQTSSRKPDRLEPLVAFSLIGAASGGLWVLIYEVGRAILT